MTGRFSKCEGSSGHASGAWKGGNGADLLSLGGRYGSLELWKGGKTSVRESV